MLKDSFGREHTYLRVSITDRCNLRCEYCMPPNGVSLLAHDDILRNEEIIRLIGIFHSLGIRKVRFTGGEPFVRRGMMDILCKTGRDYPELKLAVTTNGTLLDNYTDTMAGCGRRLTESGR